jgi:hypothetical protein
MAYARVPFDCLSELATLELHAYTSGAMYGEWLAFKCLRFLARNTAIGTFGRRLRAVGVGLKDRQDLLGHKSGRMTTHYSAAEIGNLLAAVSRIANSRESPAGRVLRLVE